MPTNLFQITLVDAFMLSPKVKHFIFNAEQTPPFHYLPGQFITIHFEKEGKTLKRSYSIANAPTHNNRIEFAAGYAENGPGTELLFNLSPGDTITVSGPFGRLILKEEMPKRYIFAATSTGITPYRAMINELMQRLDNHPSLQIIILLGVQNKEEALYAKEFLQLVEKYSKQVKFRLYLSRAQGQALEAFQFHGYVQHAFPEINLNPDEDIVYLCGNPGMIDKAFEDLKIRGFSMQQIIREKYISAPSAK